MERNIRPMKTPLSICLLSGGMDSCVTLAIALQESQKVILLHASYGQRTSKRERQAFDDIASHYDIEDKVLVELNHIAQLGGSSLLDGGPDIPSSKCFPSAEGPIPSTYVPFRNGTLLSIACALAEIRGANTIYVGAVEEDSSGYPDCRRTFFDAFERAMNLGTASERRLTVATPIIEMSKTQIVREGLMRQAPLHLSWSCYCEETTACGTCDSCRLRLRAFDGAKARDPIPYAQVPDKLKVGG